ncbi:hypothetical protein THRCLA_21872 [Thraustotheca clavata]|uniref:Secreted protein n=1 Tax=Thraustotheca clavata TaxID=74557 RepID=A0A1V9ZL95_9STRA|nr:hypothetical protein THRCLA_21872 [Thraustotheca clavata]
MRCLSLAASFFLPLHALSSPSFANVHQAKLSGCIGLPLLSLPPSCEWISDATIAGVDQLNRMINQEIPLEPMQIVSASEKTVAGNYQSHLVEMEIQVAPKNNCTETKDNCSFNLAEVAIYQLLMSQSNATGRWTLVDGMQVIDDMESGSHESELRPLPDFPASVDSASKGTFVFPQVIIYILVIAACIFSILAVIVQTLRNRRDGYSSIARTGHAQVHKKQIRRVDLRRPNPIPANEEKVLRYSHEQNERFAV